jgi:hypothetical protein
MKSPSQDSRDGFSTRPCRLGPLPKSGQWIWPFRHPSTLSLSLLSHVHFSPTSLVSLPTKHTISPSCSHVCKRKTWPSYWFAVYQGEPMEADLSCKFPHGLFRSCALFGVCFMLVSCLAYSLDSEYGGDMFFWNAGWLSQDYGVISQKIELFSVTVDKTSNPTYLRNALRGMFKPNIDFILFLFTVHSAFWFLFLFNNYSALIYLKLAE